MGRYQIYRECSFAAGFEPSTTYHVDDTGAVPARALAYANAEKNLCSVSVTYTRWEFYDVDGNKTAEAAFAPGVAGLATGDMMPPKYCLYLKANNTGGGGRASGKYIPFYTESFQANGAVSSAYTTALAAYNSALNAEGHQIDSDGIAIASWSHRGFSKRTRLRRKTL